MNWRRVFVRLTVRVNIAMFNTAEDVSGSRSERSGTSAYPERLPLESLVASYNGPSKVGVIPSLKDYHKYCVRYVNKKNNIWKKEMKRK